MTNVVLKVLRINSSKRTLWKFYFVDCCTIAGFIQRDTIVYPRFKANSKPKIWNSLPDKLWSILPSSKSTESNYLQLGVPQFSQMLEMSLNIHLNPSHACLLQGNFKGNPCILLAAKKIMGVFNQFMSYVFITDSGGHETMPWKDVSVCKVCVYCMYPKRCHGVY